MEGMNDSTGTRFNFTVAAGLPELMELEFRLTGDGGLMDLSGATWEAYYVLRGADGVGGRLSLSVEHGGRGELVLHVPGLADGEYDYAVYATDDAGGVRCVLYGVLTAVGREFGVSVGALGERRRLLVNVAAEEGVAAVLSWQGCSVAQLAAVRAVEAAERVTECVDMLREASAFVDSFNAAVAGAFRVDDEGMLWIAGRYMGVCVRGQNGVTPRIGENGNWWSGDVDTGKPSRGEAGLTPSISHDGYWVLGDWKSDVLARGRDGINGAAVRRVLVDSVAELPVEGESCNGGYFYYVPNADGEYDVYAWLERREGAGWVRVKEAYDIATAEVYGLSKLGTDEVHDVGAAVAVNGGGGLVVPVASTVDYGAVKVSSSVVEKFGGGGVYVNNGMLWVNMATQNKPGCVIYSAWGSAPDNFCVGPNTSGWIDVLNAGVNQRGVVLAAMDIADRRAGAVPEAWMVKGYIDNNFLTGVETRKVISASAEAVKEWVRLSFVQQGGCYTKAEANGLLAARYTKTEADGLLAAKASKAELEAVDKACIHKSEVWTGVVVLSEAEYNRLGDGELDETKLYIIV